MPRFELANRRDRAQLWPKLRDDGYGRSVLGERVEIRVRWEDRQAEMLDPTGKLIRVDAVLTVDRDIPIGSEIWKGAYADLPGTAGVPESDVMVVVTKGNTPSIKARASYRTVGLIRSSDTLSSRED